MDSSKKCITLYTELELGRRKNRGVKSKTIRNRPCIFCGQTFIKRQVHHNIPQSAKNVPRHEIYTENNEFPVCPNDHLGILHGNHDVEIIGYRDSTRGRVVEIELNSERFFIQDGEWIKVNDYQSSNF